MLSVDRLLPFRSDPHIDHGVQGRVLETRPEDRVLVGVAPATDDGLAQAPRCADHDDLGKSALGVEGEDDSGACEVGADHDLDADGESHRRLVEAHPFPVVDRSVGEQRGVATVAGQQQLGRSAYAARGRRAVPRTHRPSSRPPAPAHPQLSGVRSFPPVRRSCRRQGRCPAGRIPRTVRRAEWLPWCPPP